VSEFIAGLLYIAIARYQQTLCAADWNWPIREHWCRLAKHAFDGIPMLLDVAGTVPADQMEWYRKGRVVGVIADLWSDPPTWCPTCESPAPHLHPSVQHGGECHVCQDPYHRRITAENTPDRIRSLGLEPIFGPIGGAHG